MRISDRGMAHGGVWAGSAALVLAVSSRHLADAPALQIPMAEIGLTVWLQSTTKFDGGLSFQMSCRRATRWLSDIAPIARDAKGSLLPHKAATGSRGPRKLGGQKERPKGMKSRVRALLEQRCSCSSNIHHT